jgi:hypothetical protein
LDSELICSWFQLRNIIQAVRSSPQWQEAWLEEANAFLQKAAALLSVVLGHAATMLILDVKTQWSSTHQMLCKAIIHWDAFPQINVVVRSGYGLSQYPGWLCCKK